MLHSPDFLQLTLRHAVCNGDVAAIKSLVQGGADVNQLSENGYSLLMYAVVSDRPQSIMVLADLSAEVDFESVTGWTPLICAAALDKIACLETLVALGSQVDRRNFEGSTALMVAAQKGHSRAIASLLEVGANISLKNRKGETAADIAEREGCGGVLRLLKQYIEAREDSKKCKCKKKSASLEELEEGIRIPGLALRELDEEDLYRRAYSDAQVIITQALKEVLPQAIKGQLNSTRIVELLDEKLSDRGVGKNKKKQAKSRKVA